MCHIAIEAFGKLCFNGLWLGFSLWQFCYSLLLKPESSWVFPLKMVDLSIVLWQITRGYLRFINSWCILDLLVIFVTWSSGSFFVLAYGYSSTTPCPTELGGTPRFPRDGSLLTTMEHSLRYTEATGGWPTGGFQMFLFDNWT